MVIGLAGSAHFTILNYSLFSLDSEGLEDLGRSRPRAAELLGRLRRELDRTWYTLLTGSLLFNLALALTVCGALANLGGGWSLGRGGLVFAGGPVWALSALALAALAVLFLGEVLPGLLSARFLEALAPGSARCMRFWLVVLWPLTAPPLMMLRFAGRLSGVSVGDALANLEVEKRLLTLIGVGNVDVSLEEEEREMIDHALEFGESTVGDIMTPRSEIMCFDTESSQQEALAIMRRTPRSRVLVYTKSLDEVLGVLHTKQILLNPEVDYHELLHAALFVDQDMDLVELLALMRGQRTQLVVVLDSYGATAGVASFDDLLEALVGQIPDDRQAAPVRGPHHTRATTGAG